MWCSACCPCDFKLEFAPRLLIVQNGTTNSAHELVDKLNKADLPSSVGNGLTASLIPLMCCTLVTTLYDHVVLQRLWWLLLLFTSHWCNLTFVGRLPCQPRTAGLKAMVPTQEKSGELFADFPHDNILLCSSVQFILSCNMPHLHYSGSSLNCSFHWQPSTA